jgi:outer membrane lipoprotein SlyB
MKIILARLVVGIFSLMLLACATSRSGDVYSRDDARKIQMVRMGVVESVRTVKIEGTQSNIGTATGAVIGGIAGSSVGSGGRDSAVAAVLGAVVGGIAGSAAEEFATRKDGIEITIKLDNGTLVSVVQEATEQFSPGQRVRLIESGGTTRVSK